MKKVKPKKYKCPMCGNEFNKPVIHKYNKLKMCPKLGCGYLATPLNNE